MRRAKEHSGAIGILVCVGIAAAAAGCGESQLGIPTGSGGALPGVGGATGILGTGGASLGTGGAMTGRGGATGNSGQGTGGLVVAGTGGSKGTGGRVAGGTVGNGGRTTVLMGTGGRGVDAGVAGATGTSAGGRGTGGAGTGGAAGTGAGGRGTGGAGGAATGGATSPDGGAPDGAPAKCVDITTQTACEARTDCHPVFEDPHNCDCLALGCCTRFKGCADGEKADCTGPALCKMMEPYCEGPYVVAYAGSCYEGCVRQTGCAFSDCPQTAPADGSLCGVVPVSRTCFYEDCGGAGRTIATCTPGESNWKVTTTACTTVPCDTDPASGRGTICAEGKVCIIAGSNTIISILPALPIFVCVGHTCGTGPITAGCITSSYGPCTAAYSAAGAVFSCEM